MAEVLGKMIAADVIVMATPVYFYTMNGQMKTLIDRTYARYTQIRDKEMYFIVTAAGSRKQAMERTLEGFRDSLPALPAQEKRGSSTGPALEGGRYQRKQSDE